MKYLWKLDNFDSEVFGFKVAKIEGLEGESVKDLIKDLLKNKIKYAIIRTQSNNFPLIHSLEKYGFVLVDGLISLKIEIAPLPEESASQIREGESRDLEELKTLTVGLYSISRVFNDPLIPKDKASNFYAKWIENSILGKAADSVLIWEDKEQILGYITLQKKGQIPLIGVSPQSRGKGIAKKLVRASFNKFNEWGIKTVMVETQMGNISALRVYQNCGFKIVDSFLTLRWAIDD